MKLEQKKPEHEDYHFRREDRAKFWERMTAHLSEKPENFMIALDNISRWEKSGRVNPAPLTKWRTMILTALESPKEMAELLAFMAAPNHDSEPLKSCSPFAGVLKEERVT